MKIPAAGTQVEGAGPRRMVAPIRFGAALVVPGRVLAEQQVKAALPRAAAKRDKNPLAGPLAWAGPLLAAQRTGTGLLAAPAAARMVRAAEQPERARVAGFTARVV
jgi:hypothetical protein